MYAGRKFIPKIDTECRNKLLDYSVLSDSGISDTVKIVNDKKPEDESRLEQLLQYMQSVDEILNQSNKHYSTDDDNDDDDSIFRLEFPFSDDEQMLVNRTIRLDELAKKFDSESNQFSREYLEILEEIAAETEPNSPPCSTCSLCSSCETDMWDRLNFNEAECLVKKPTSLEPDVKEELKKLNDEHNELIKKLLSVTSDSDDNEKEILTENENVETDSKGQRQIGKLLKKKTVATRKQKKREIRRPHDEDFDGLADWESTLSDDLFISPPDYDYFCDSKSREIHFQKDMIPWSVMERSRKKCANWLKRNRFKPCTHIY